MNKKIINSQKLKLKLLALQKKKKKIVFTNGCFDILHAGHIRYLKEAKKWGDVLVIALNSDVSVHKIKGPKRPIVPQQERAEVMAALECVDFVTFFNEDNPHRIISDLKPDILVKGGDWKPSQIIGSDIVLKNGGKVKSIRYHKGKSTTHIIQKILKMYVIT
ncbi:MAG TPA: D-glycero-beta-D-manno-heptose 1-phosphate adenylyltransferase [Deltaproteobacteria bacterium]|nr:D-glycero-beta-D-manno-heptose 1-phosphate adenylyltransferase [Deltaproteobacteria bacterium]